MISPNVRFAADCIAQGSSKLRCLHLLVAVSIVWSTIACRAEPPKYSEHQDLSYYLTPEGRRVSVRSIEDWQRRREHVVAGLEAVMGPFPCPRHPVPLNVEILAEYRDSDCVRRKVAYHTDRLDTRVHAWLMLPLKPSPDKRAAILCLHQTVAEGKDSPAGLADRPSMHYARELTQRGFITLTPDYSSLGEYQHDFGNDDYDSGSMKAVYDNVRAIDLLQSLPEVDAKRIGCIGHSLGGHNGLFTAAFDSRVKVVVTCSGFTSFHYDDMPSWTGPRYMPLIASQFGDDPNRVPFDFTEVVAAIAPRAVFIVAPLHDHDFAVAGVRDVVAAAMPIYDLYARPTALRAIYPDSEHDFPDSARRDAYAFLEQSLK